MAKDRQQVDDGERAALVARLRRPGLTTGALREAYDRHEVETFLARAAAALSGAGELSAADVAAVRFTTTRRGPGYDLAQVDRLLDELEAHLAPAAAPEVPLSRDDLVALLRDPAIARVRWRRGYRADEVDLFLTQVVGSLLGHRDPIAVRDVEGARFRPARLRRGYEMREVDRLLDRVVVHLRSARLARSAPRGDRWSQGDSNP